MWERSQSDQIFRFFSEYPRQTTVVSSATPGGPPLLTAEAGLIERAIRARADECRIPVVVRTQAVECLPGHAHVVVYHVPDATREAECAVDNWNNEGGALPVRAE